MRASNGGIALCLAIGIEILARATEWQLFCRPFPN